MPFLILERGDDAGDSIRIDSTPCVLGRLATCDIYQVFEGNDKVSRQHATVSEEDDKFFVEDLGSRNGTIVNGRRLEQRCQLKAGDRIDICGVTFRFQDDPLAEDHQAPAAANFQTIDDQWEPSLGILSSISIGDSQVSDGDIELASPERKLEALIELLSSLGESLQEERLLENLLDGLFQVFPAADRGFVAMQVETETPVQINAAKFRNDSSEQTLRISRTIAEHVMKTSEAVLSSDVRTDNLFADSQSLAISEVRSFVCAPLINKEGTAMGIVQLETIGANQQFSSQDLDILAAVVPQVSLSLNFSNLYQQALRRVALDRDLELARKVQLELLPSGPPKLADYEFYNYYKAAFHVGGDYFDYIPLLEDRLAIVLADVSGKGVSASLLMSKISGELKMLFAGGKSAGEAVSMLNDQLCETGVAGRFVTMVVAILDIREHRVVLVNAGHVPPLLRHPDGEVAEVGLDDRCIAIGLLPEQEFREHTLSLQPGDSITLVTDGFTEAMNASDELYGEERLMAQLKKPLSTVARLGEGLLRDLDQFVGKHPQSDDMCLVSFARVLPE